MCILNLNTLYRQTEDAPKHETTASWRRQAGHASTRSQPNWLATGPARATSSRTECPAQSLQGTLACYKHQSVSSSNVVLLEKGFTIMLLHPYWLMVSTAAFLLCQFQLVLAQETKVTPLAAKPLPGFSGGEK